MKIVRLLLFCLVLLTITRFSNARAQTTKDTKAAQSFVQDFYKWYEAIYNQAADVVGTKHQLIGPVEVVNKYRKNDFSPTLANALIKYYSKASKSGEVGNLDMDPFLAAQDIAPDNYSYQVGNVKQSKANFFVDVHLARRDLLMKMLQKSDLPVIAEITKSNGKWIFTNFIYPDDKYPSNLLKLIGNRNVN